MMAAAIPDAIRPRLGRFLRLLASDQPGEVVAAACAIGRTLKAAGVDWHALAEVVEHPVAVAHDRHEEKGPRARQRRKAQPDEGHINWPPVHRQVVGQKLEYGLIHLTLTTWERDFVANIVGRLRDPRGRLTFRQAEVVERLLAKIDGHR